MAYTLFQNPRVRVWLAGLALCVAGGLARAQELPDIQQTQLPDTPNQTADLPMPSSLDLNRQLAHLPAGFAVYNISLFSGYERYSAPDTITGLGSSILGSGTTYGAVVTGGWNRVRAASRTSIVYSVSYAQQPLASVGTGSNGFGHRVRFSRNGTIGRKWEYGASANASVSRLEDNLFQPPVFSEAPLQAPSFQDLATAAASGQFNNSQIAAMLTGAPILETPAQTVLFGQRTLSAGVQNTWTYAYTTRLQLKFNVSASRDQNWSLQSGIPANTQPTLRPDVTSAGAGIGFSYSVTPRTQIGVNSMVTRSYYSFEKTQDTSNTLTIGHNSGRHWVMSVFGGFGHIQAFSHSIPVVDGPQYLAGGSLAYKTRQHELFTSYEHSIHETFGYGTQPIDSTAAGWKWARPGSRWFTRGQWNYQDSSPDARIAAVHRWFVSGAVGYHLDTNWDLSAQFSHLTDAGGYSTLAVTSLNGLSARVILAWHPTELGIR